ncbi:MAG: hypothetical protein H6517_01875 [Microthrixaceae bacterium]|nr:hypothetical protein [Microthrixaceae bacterium]MCB9386557.1 hypothetical protein [Microthrixaceae bacterium]MCO5320074.1 hypothetical protein [Microthrixaceae bacterium]
MTLLVCGILAGVVYAFVIHRATAPLFSRSLFTRTNYRGAELPTAVGLVIPATVVGVLALYQLLDTLRWSVDSAALRSLTLTTTAAFGFSLLGLMDDVSVDEGTSGYLGHIRAMLRGDLSAGALKLVVLPTVAIVVVYPRSGDSAVRLLLDGALVALAANLANLFDRAPGRVIKVTLLGSVAVFVGSAAAAGTFGLAVICGAALVLLVPDLRERMMLGDTGANPLGASVGLAAVLVFQPVTRNWVLGGLLLMNLASEFVSFSAVIDRVAPLRGLDRLGRRHRG